MAEQYYVYIMANKINTCVYVGMTSNLVKRAYEHRNKLIEGFTKRYNIIKLVHYESTNDVRLAIEREKQLKGGSRKQKEELINKMNSEWKDLYETIV